MNEPNQFMRRALRLAERGRGRVSPNPLVGAVIVRDGEIVGEGAHLKLGGPHAEIHALRQAGDRARGATLYVTLEPCSFYGRTPPCVEALIQAGVSRVECALPDPDPRVSGNGFQQLRQAGIQVSVGLLQAAAEKQNAGYLKHRSLHLPLVTLKLAQTLDGNIATATGDSRWITGEAARRHVHRQRSRVDAVMVGAGTVIADDPLLTVRHVRGRDPRPMVVDGLLRAPADARVFGRPGAVLVTAAEGAAPRQGEYTARGVDVWTFPGVNGQVDLRQALLRAAAEGITHIMLEGGSRLAAAALTARVVDQVQIYIAPTLLGTGLGSIGEMGIERIAQSVHLEDVHIRRLDRDLLYTARVRYGCSQD
jgi:diaminohydroxyphosphoribosylaminopyrimidine deaminase / 5-amino-6-(5-phosphoribosylamino)uracil reductase